MHVFSLHAVGVSLLSCVVGCSSAAEACGGSDASGGGAGGVLAWVHAFQRHVVGGSILVLTKVCQVICINQVNELLLLFNRPLLRLRVPMQILVHYILPLFLLPSPVYLILFHQGLLLPA